MAEAKQKRARTCVGCGKQADKVELMRIVRTDEGAHYDPSGRTAGRGAYVCSPECLEKAFASRKLQRALRCGIERSDVDRVLSGMEEPAQKR